ncbi:sulfatase-like hydrolase/transferase [Microbulbifer agarilyticus]|uniref:sulfatase-like hydrolase/transferase n=1 Tax=Microbulbifer agarilyticus TaxID=260552 RepID=UPI001C96283B|nr:sulfatase-like hydrolase/transferase [Microbulbifer agarilyticus]MBY6212017.1 sulfatase-like hydrolase/transferase [Microbulbifer agarilyticus]
MNVLRTLAVTLLSLAAGGAFAATAEKIDKPNIVVILADDLGYADVGFNGSNDIVTPNLDKLASEGMTFSEAYTAHPFCGPSRAALMTGRYPHKIGSQFNLPVRGSFVGVPTEEKFVSKILQENGYFTGAVGKWHLGEAPEYHPNRRGFDEFYGFLGGGHNYFPEQFNKFYAKQKAQGLTNIDPYARPLEHNGKEVEVNEYITDALSREGVAFVQKAAGTGKPFFLYLAYNAPHSPLQAKQEDMAKFPNIKDKDRKTYAGMVYAMDRGIGELVEALKSTGQLDNTLIVFFSDNGGDKRYGANNDPLRAGKGSVFEGGFRTPMVMHWPKQINARSRFDHPVKALDLFPTFASLAGAELEPDNKLDGKNLLSFLQSGEPPHKDELIFALRHRGSYSDASVRRNQWKAVKVGEHSSWKLFDIERDKEEKHDLAEEYPLMLRDMVREMEVWSWDNAQPGWFHIHKEGALWRQNGMPRFDKTFATD